MYVCISMCARTVQCPCVHLKSVFPSLDVHVLHFASYIINTLSLI